MTRIVAGVAGGRRLQVPPRGTRPTSDRVREALFSSLEALVELDGARVLDLYAGSGALGFEALSRGAAHAVFVESDKRAAEVLKANAKALALPGATVIARTADAVVAAPAEQPCDVVFADPPYAVGDDELHRVLTALVANGWTADGTVVIVERAARSAEPIWPSPLESLRSKRYGDTALYWAEHVTPTGDADHAPEWTHPIGCYRPKP
ncbi:16S rRNA (guanine(966)-N(2))-methyltransferase RsmD [Saccharothrix australiensis]|uniref:16S rRNA (Guanine966-N2)-methyltransferase n=1 Tax=Saccharothrix australiensis TaxID=2072 RepID=A0A495W742_9PSEU|nr:16S rRNA (guanine(966)-N(2))-methyltransferase RsmD [Saccharothrix australiensis]RKT57094.1 16S rRNA (guanine966-N2)-methyltransferase [Saccharothrix australiensis]